MVPSRYLNSIFSLILAMAFGLGSVGQAEEASSDCVDTMAKLSSLYGENVETSAQDIRHEAFQLIIMRSSLLNSKPFRLVVKSIGPSRRKFLKMSDSDKNHVASQIWKTFIDTQYNWNPASIENMAPITLAGRMKRAENNGLSWEEEFLNCKLIWMIKSHPFLKDQIIYAVREAIPFVGDFEKEKNRQEVLRKTLNGIDADPRWLPPGAEPDVSKSSVWKLVSVEGPSDSGIFKVTYTADNNSGVREVGLTELVTKEFPILFNVGFFRRLNEAVSGNEEIFIKNFETLTPHSKKELARQTVTAIYGDIVPRTIKPEAFYQLPTETIERNKRFLATTIDDGALRAQLESLVEQHLKDSLKISQRITKLEKSEVNPLAKFVNWPGSPVVTAAGLLGTIFGVGALGVAFPHHDALIGVSTAAGALTSTIGGPLGFQGVRKKYQNWRITRDLKKMKDKIKVPSSSDEGEE